MGILRRLARMGLTLTMPRHRWLERGPADSEGVALTFDDGPHPEHTPRILDLLADLQIPATFFVVGQCAAQHPEVIRRMVSEGHQVANHTWFHHEPCQVNARALIEEVCETRSLLRNLTGSEIRLFRPPKGEFTFTKLRWLWREHQTVALWTADPKDFAMSNSQQADQWARQYVPRGGDIVLMHDNHPWGAQMLPTVVERARDAELNFVTLSQWTTRYPLESAPTGPEWSHATKGSGARLSSLTGEVSR